MIFINITLLAKRFLSKLASLTRQVCSLATVKTFNRGPSFVWEMKWFPAIEPPQMHIKSNFN